MDYIERPNFKFSSKNLRSWEPTIDDFSSMIILFDPEKVNNAVYKNVLTLTMSMLLPNIDVEV